MYEIFEQLLQKFGVTPYRVSKEAGVSQSMLSEWKRGTYTPKQENLKKIADYFGVTVDYLLTGQEKGIEQQNSQLTDRDEKDIAKDLDMIRTKLINKEGGPASFDGQNLSEETAELLLIEIESMLKKIKVMNKDTYNPKKNKK